MMIMQSPEMLCCVDQWLGSQRLKPNAEFRRQLPLGESQSSWLTGFRKIMSAKQLAQGLAHRKHPTNIILMLLQHFAFLTT